MDRDLRYLLFTPEVSGSPIFTIGYSLTMLIAGGEKSSPSIIRATCTFDTKKVLSDNNVIVVTRYTVSNKKILLFFYFYPEVSAFLVEN